MAPLAYPYHLGITIFTASANNSLGNTGSAFSDGYEDEDIRIHPGMDWAVIVQKTGDNTLSKSLVMSSSLFLILLGVVLGRLLLPRVETKIGLIPAWKLVVTAYLSFSVTALAASAMVPADDRLFMLVGGIGNGALFTFWMLICCIGNSSRSPVLKAKSAPLPMLIASLVTAIYVFLLGSGINF